MKGAAIRLLLLVGLLGAVGALKGWRADHGNPGVTLAAGALLLCGLFAGKVAKGLGLPRLTGYLLIGVLIGPHVLGLVPLAGVSGLTLVQGLAVSLISLTAGTELELSLLRRTGKKVVVLCVLVGLAIYAFTLTALLLLRPLLPFLEGLTFGQAFAVASLVAVVLASFSPTVTFAVAQETGAEGSFTEFLMATVIITDMVVMVAFAITAALTRAAMGGSVDLAGLAQGIGWELFGSLAVGALFGALLVFYLHKVAKELSLFITIAGFFVAQLAGYLHLSPLLLALSAGALVANLDERLGHRLRHGIDRAAVAVFALFFALAGAGVHVDVLTKLGPVAVVLVLARAAALYLSVRRFAPREDPRLGQFLWMGLVSQAGVTLGLAALIGKSFPAFGPGVETLMVAVVAIGELVGPILTRKALTASGEVPSHPEPEKV